MRVAVGASGSGMGTVGLDYTDKGSQVISKVTFILLPGNEYYNTSYVFWQITRVERSISKGQIERCPLAKSDIEQCQ